MEAWYSCLADVYNHRTDVLLVSMRRRFRCVYSPADNRCILSIYARLLSTATLAVGHPYLVRFSRWTTNELEPIMTMSSTKQNWCRMTKLFLTISIIHWITEFGKSNLKRPHSSFLPHACSRPSQTKGFSLSSVHDRTSVEPWYRRGRVFVWLLLIGEDYLEPCQRFQGCVFISFSRESSIPSNEREIERSLGLRKTDRINILFVRFHSPCW